MIQFEHYHKIRNQPAKSHELWQQTLMGQALKKVASLPEDIADQLQFSVLEKILFELLKLPRTLETLVSCEVMPPKDAVAFLHALVTAGCLTRQGAAGAKHILPLEIRKLKSKYGIAAAKKAAPQRPGARPVVRKRVTGRPGAPSSAARPTAPSTAKRPSAPRPGFATRDNPISFNRDDVLPSRPGATKERLPMPPSRPLPSAQPPPPPPTPARTSTRRAPGPGGRVTASRRPPPPPAPTPPQQQQPDADGGAAAYEINNPYKVDTGQDVELQAWAENNLATDLAKKIQAKHDTMSTENHYQFLEIDERASAMEIKAAYQTMARSFYPQSLTKAGITDMDLQFKCGTIFSRLKLVHQILTNDAKRSEYDLSLQQKAMLASQEGETSSGAPKASMHKLEADSYLKKGQFHLAEEHYRLAVEENPLEAPLKTAYAWSIAMNTKRPDAERVTIATDILKEVIQEFRYADAAYKLGLMAQGSGNSNAAMKFFDLALSLDSNHPGAIRQKEMWEGAAKRAAARKAQQNKPAKGGVSKFLSRLKTS